MFGPSGGTDRTWRSRVHAGLLCGAMMLTMMALMPSRAQAAGCDGSVACADGASSPAAETLRLNGAKLRLVNSLSVSYVGGSVTFYNPAGPDASGNKPFTTLTWTDPRVTIEDKRLGDETVTTISGYSATGTLLFAFTPTDLFIARQQGKAAPGTLDPMFANAGIANVDFGGVEGYANSVLEQPDGSVIAAGAAGDRVVVVRFTADGELDATFGANGVATAPFERRGETVGTALVRQPDGKFVVGGGGALPGQADTDHSFALARFTSTGALDTSFGSGGYVLTALPDRFRSIVFDMILQPNGTLVAGGRAPSSTGSNVALARYSSSGVLDSSFGTGGLAIVTPPGLPDMGTFAIAAQPDGRIVAAGYATNSTSAVASVVRVTAGGVLDTSFGTGGAVATSLGSGVITMAIDVAVQPDGKIVTGGGTVLTDGTYAFALTRYTATGARDTNFGSNGVTTTRIGDGQNISYSLALQSDGKILAAGAAEEAGVLKAAIARYKPDGSLDTKFGAGGTGIATYDFGGSAMTWIWGIGLDSNGDLLTAGTTLVHGLPTFSVARFLL